MLLFIPRLQKHNKRHRQEGTRNRLARQFLIDLDAYAYAGISGRVPIILQEHLQARWVLAAVARAPSDAHETPHRLEACLDYNAKANTEG